MRIGTRIAMAWEVFCAMGQAGLRHALHQALGQQADGAGVIGKSPIANHTASTVIQVQHRRKTHIYTASPQLRAHHIAAG